MSASQYLLPTGYANTPVAAADGSLWVNHFSGLFRLYHGETTTILAYRDDEQGLTWMPSDPLNPYYSHHNAALPSPVSFGSQVYVCCWDCQQKTSHILCFSSCGTMLWDLSVNGICTNLIATTVGIFALCGSSLKQIGNGTIENSITLFASGEIIGHRVVEDRCFFVVHTEQQVRLLQVSGNLRLTADYLLDTGTYKFRLSVEYPLLTANHQNLFVFFKVMRDSFSGLDAYCFRFAPNGEIVFEGQNRYGVSDPHRISMPGVVFATETGFMYADVLCTEHLSCPRLIQVEKTHNNTVSVINLPEEVQSCDGYPPLVIGTHYLFPCYDMRDKLWIGLFHAGSFQMKRCPKFHTWFVHENRIWICRWKKSGYQIQQMPDWIKE